MIGKGASSVTLAPLPDPSNKETRGWPLFSLPRIPRERLRQAGAVIAKGWPILRGSSDELAVLAGATVFVAGIAIVSVAVACMTGGLILAAFGVGRLAFQARSGK